MQVRRDVEPRWSSPHLDRTKVHEQELGVMGPVIPDT
jgi:hypothetical protein